MTNEKEIIPHLFRTEFRKITSVLCKTFGIANMELAEDIVSDTFLKAAETWEEKGLPENPTAWLYAVAKNKAKDHFKRNKLFQDKITPNLKHAAETNQGTTLPEIDLSPQNISDSQLQMMFAISDPSIPQEAQIGLALRILCGFGIEEITAAFLTKKDTINKRLHRAKEKLRGGGIKMEMPEKEAIISRIDSVLRMIYLLFNEGYYSSSNDNALRKDLCLEAIRLNLLLLKYPATNIPATNALLSLMCFHTSRFEARTNAEGELILFEDQDKKLWNKDLILKGEEYLNRAATGEKLTKYHLEAAIAYWHIQVNEEKRWEEILQLYNILLQIEYSPMAALNRTYALAKADGKQKAIIEAKKLNLDNNHLYHSLLGYLFTEVDNKKAIAAYQQGLSLAKTEASRKIISGYISALNNQ